MRIRLPLWMILGWLRISAQVKCGRCLSCSRCEEIKRLES